MSAGRHRMRSKLHLAAAAATAAVLVVTGGAWFGYRELIQSKCTGEIRLAVAVASELAPAVDAAASQWVKDGAAVGTDCIRVDVSASDPVDVAAVVAAKHGAVLAGVGQASGTAVSPDVWVPDSSTWLLRLKKDATAFAPTNGASIARSPIVVAMPEPIATRLGWPDKKFKWTDLLNQVNNTSTPLRTGIVEPTRDAAGLSGLLSLTAAANGAGVDAQRKTVGALRALATGRSSLRNDLLARFPKANDGTTIASSLGAAALSEEDVIAYNSEKPPVPLAALYMEPAPMPLDYPYAVLPGIEPSKASAARVLFELLTSPAFRDRLAAQSLRAPDGNWGEGFKAPQGAPSPASGAPTTPANGGSAAGGLDPAAIQRVVSSWSIATQSGRMLAVIDVSGSMKDPVPSANNRSREEVTVEAARRGLGLFDDSWSIGLWTFSTKLVGNRDYRELVPIGPLSGQRAQLEGALGGVKPSDGNTGLYDTTLAAYQAVQDNWQPGRVNSIVLFTDGKNEDDDGLNQQQLLAKLKQLADPDRPVQVIMIGIGEGVSKAELESITKVTGGDVFVTKDPSEIGSIFLSAIARRPPAPR
ncbi:substrate-binding domain-containing protein [Micromonospora sp. NPDC049175]|uniref:substrate-binding domain-containing protein n=1 Tax=Micromonospora sp. NPDC049175 TaxID=3364266 RepID=UPI003718EC3A